MLSDIIRDKVREAVEWRNSRLDEIIAAELAGGARLDDISLDEYPAQNRTVVNVGGVPKHEVKFTFRPLSE